ncbi:MAG: hypothetical protein HKN17_04600, partial [Rhodothermales bacterium]|nr:hypothetical protein [Rhodothermales bacterium]
MRISHSARFRSAGGLFILFGMLLSWPAFGQAYTIELTDRNASGWFGGDDRANGPRHVGNGQDVLIDADMRVESFSMYITGNFDFSANPDGYGHAVTIKMNVRNDQGEVISTHSADLPDTFAGDWVLFDDLDVEAASGTTLIFTWYLVGALDPATQYNSGYGANADNPYQDGSAWGKHGASDEDMEEWTGWVRNSSWDAVFIVSGQQIQITNTEDDPGVVRDLRLDPAYPNPFNP